MQTLLLCIESHLHFSPHQITVERYFCVCLRKTVNIHPILNIYFDTVAFIIMTNKYASPLLPHLTGWEERPLGAWFVFWNKAPETCTHLSSSISKLDSLSESCRQRASLLSISLCSFLCSRKFSSLMWRSSSRYCAIFSESEKPEFLVRLCSVQSSSNLRAAV